MKIEVTVCNICQDPARPTRVYEVRRSGRVGEVDLCEEHGLPLEDALGPEAPRRPRRRGIEVTPIDQIRRMS